eukprot:g7441.t1
MPLLVLYIRSSIGEYLYVLLPKDEYVTDDIRLWQGRIKTIEDRVGKMIKGSEHKVLKKIDESNKVMKDDITKLKELKCDITKLKEMKSDITKLTNIKEDDERMKEDINEIKQMLRNIIVGDGERTLS